MSYLPAGRSTVFNQKQIPATGRRPPSAITNSGLNPPGTDIMKRLFLFHSLQIRSGPGIDLDYVPDIYK